jgi:hypothetical protein
MATASPLCYYYDYEYRKKKRTKKDNSKEMMSSLTADVVASISITNDLQAIKDIAWIVDNRTTPPSS